MFLEYFCSPFVSATNLSKQGKWHNLEKRTKIMLKKKEKVFHDHGWNNIKIKFWACQEILLLIVHKNASSVPKKADTFRLEPKHKNL